MTTDTKNILDQIDALPEGGRLIPADPAEAAAVRNFVDKANKVHINLIFHAACHVVMWAGLDEPALQRARDHRRAVGQCCRVGHQKIFVNGWHPCFLLSVLRIQCLALVSLYLGTFITRIMHDIHLSLVLRSNSKS